MLHRVVPHGVPGHAFLRRLSFAALVAGLGFLVVQTADQSAGAADPPQKLKQKLKQEAKKKAEEEARKAEEAKKAEEARATDEARKKAAEEERRIAAAKKAAAASKLDAVALAALIDKHIDAKLVAEKITPSADCTDAEYLRRAYLDVTGVIPTADQAKAFLDDKSSGKRAKLIDTLLDDPNYGRKHADIWLGKLFPKDSDNRFVQPGPFHEWLKGEFNKNTPWDQFVSTLVSATGTVDEHPEVTFFLANRSIDKLTDATTQHFLGVRLGCASATTTRSPRPSRPNTGAWPRSSARWPPTGRRTPTRGRTTANSE